MTSPRFPRKKTSRTVVEILSIAESRQFELIDDLSPLELEVLIFALNKIRYSIQEQTEFIRFYMEVHSLLRECKAEQKNGSDSSFRKK